MTLSGFAVSLHQSVANGLILDAELTHSKAQTLESTTSYHAVYHRVWMDKLLQGWPSVAIRYARGRDARPGDGVAPPRH